MNLVANCFNGYTGGADDNDAQGNHLVTHALTAKGHDASEDGTGRGTPLIASSITASYGKQIDNSDRNGGPPNLIFQSQASSTQSMNPSSLHARSIGTTKTPTVMNGMSVRRLTPLECERLQGFPDGWTCLCQPIEAYREDPDEAHLYCTCPDGPRYRVLGNAVTLPVIEWLGHRLLKEALMHDLPDRPPPLSKPYDTDGVICPDAMNKSKIHAPEKVYESENPDGSRIRRGILGPHKHRRSIEECPWTGLPIIITPKPGAKKKE